MAFDTQATRDPSQERAVVTFLAAIRAHPWLVAVITLAAVGAAIAFLLTREPSYEATANILVEPVSPEDETFTGLPLVRDTGDPVRTVQTAAHLVESPAVADLAEDRLGADWSRERVLEEVEVSPQGESNVLAITATAPSASEAARAANEFARAALDVRAETLRDDAEALLADLEARLEATPIRDPVTRAALATRVDQIRAVMERGDPTLLLSESAIAPDAATGTPAPIVAVLSLLAGLALASGTAVLLELATPRVRDEDEAVRLYPLPVLARVPELPTRARRGPAGSNWYMPPAIREPYRAVALQLEHQSDSRRAVMITSATRGDGKTTSAINLGVTLAASGNSVVVLDFDLRNPQLAKALQIEDGPAIGDLLDPELELERLLAQPSDLPTLRVLPLFLDRDGGELSETASWRLPELLEQARALAQYVIVDTPPLGEVADALRLAPVTDDVIVVMRPGTTSRRQLKVMRELLERTGFRPAGCIVIGAAGAPTKGYYGEGMIRAREAALSLRANGAETR